MSGMLKRVERLAARGFHLTWMVAAVGVLSLVGWVVLWPVVSFLEPNHVPPFGDPLGRLLKGFLFYAALELFFFVLGVLASLRPADSS